MRGDQVAGIIDRILHWIKTTNEEGGDAKIIIVEQDVSYLLRHTDQLAKVVLALRQSREVSNKVRHLGHVRELPLRAALRDILDRHTVWGLVGVLRGAERNQAYRRELDGALVKEGPETLLRRGTVVAVSPALGDIHAVRNALDDQPSMSIHIYGGNIGAIRRSTFSPADGTAKPFISGYTNNVVPNLWDRSGNQA